MQSPMLQPALIGGLVAGVLSSLPIVSIGNLCCCLWVVAGGMTAAYLLQQNQAAPITAGDGALVGLYAGLVGAALSIIVSIPVSWMMGPMQQQMLERIAERTGQELPAGFRGGLGGVMYLAFGCVTIFLSAVFSTLGGLLGAAVFRKPGQPGVVDIPAGP